MRVFIAPLLCLIPSAALAQNTTCPTRPTGDNSNSCASTQFVQSATGVVSVTSAPFNAKCDGVTDDTAAIQAAINALPNDGGILTIPAFGNCKISSPLGIGNGQLSAVSTKRGVILRGLGIPGANGAPFFNGFPATGAPKITWAGGATAMISINGPLKGWGVQNLALDCASLANFALLVTSAGEGDNQNLVITNCQSAGIASTANPLGGYSGVGNVDSSRNNWYNLDILVPSVAGAKGILLDGASDASANTDYNTFSNVFVRMVGGVLANIGVDLAISDSNVFTSLNISGGGVNSFNVYFDYTRSANFPLGNAFYGVDSNGGGTQWNNNGSPGAGARCNYLYALMESNAGTNPNLANLCSFFGGAPQTFTPSVTCGTATIATNTARFRTQGKVTWLNIDFTMTALGTCNGTTVNITFNLPNTTNANGVVSGQEIVNSGKAAACLLQTGTTTAAQCKKADATALVAGDRFVLSGTYENQ